MKSHNSVGGAVCEVSGPSLLLSTIHDNEGLKFLNIFKISIQVLITKQHTHIYVKHQSYLLWRQPCLQRRRSYWNPSCCLQSVIHFQQGILHSEWLQSGSGSASKHLVSTQMHFWSACCKNRFSQLLLLSCKYHSPVPSDTLDTIHTFTSSVFECYSFTLFMLTAVVVVRRTCLL